MSSSEVSSPTVAALRSSGAAHRTLALLAAAAAVLAVATLLRQPGTTHLGALGWLRWTVTALGAGFLLSTALVERQRGLARELAICELRRDWLLRAACQLAVLAASVAALLRGLSSRSLLAGLDLVLVALAIVALLSLALAAREPWRGRVVSTRTQPVRHALRLENGLFRALYFVLAAALVLALVVVELQPLPGVRGETGRSARQAPSGFKTFAQRPVAARRAGRATLALVTVLAACATLGLLLTESRFAPTTSVVIYVDAELPLVAEVCAASASDEHRVRVVRSPRARHLVGATSPGAASPGAASPGAGATALTRADLVCSDDVLSLVRLEREGLLASRSADHAAGEHVAADQAAGDHAAGEQAASQLAESLTGLAPPYRSTQQTWQALAADARVLVVHTGLVPPEAWPRSIESLAEPAWRGRVAMADPRHGTAAVQAACQFAAWGEARASDFYRRLFENEVRVLADSRRVAEVVATGRAACGWTDASAALDELSRGRPVAVIYPDQGPDQTGTLFVPIAAAVLSATRQPTAAWQVLDELAAPRAAVHLAERLVPLRHAEVVAAGIETPKTVRAMTVDFEQAADVQERAAAVLASIFAPL